jgi:hypothetical protein
MIILEILGYILVALLILLVLILVLPLEFRLYGQKQEETFFKASVILFKGAVVFQFLKPFKEQAKMYVRILGFKKNIKTHKVSEKENKKEKPKKENSRNYLEPSFLKCLKNVLKHIKPKKFAIEGRVGFEDPYVTGIVCAVLNVLCQELKKANIKVNTVFDEEIFEGKCLIQGRVVLAYIAYIALRLYLSRPVRIKQKAELKEVKSYGS